MLEETKARAEHITHLAQPPDSPPFPAKIQGVPTPLLTFVRAEPSLVETPSPVSPPRLPYLKREPDELDIGFEVLGDDEIRSLALDA